MTKNSRLSATAVTAALATTAALLAAASGPTSAAPDDTTTSTFLISPKKVSYKNVDIGKPGPTIGDRHLTALTLEQEGAAAGRLLIECVSIDRVFEGRTCDLALQLADGTLFFEGMGFHHPIRNVGAGDDTVYALTGGSGAYESAAGKVTVGLEDTGPVTITLSR